ncbi:hypothetical protein [Leptospira kmetyi]|uniref:hypothetical protein n=1 Tax=Leptospira kmetyi TaxID=408139 RepID=UPI001083B621|nr:hypothetical protein [Leptospira kmetyi]TGL73140.1 hypothetical protein EHQ67_00030 [Leptospira kmetyi]
MTYQEVKFQKFEEDLLNLEKTLLEDFNIIVPNGSELESIILESIKFSDNEKNAMYYAKNEDFRQAYSNIIGLHDIYTKIFDVKTHDNYKDLKGHLNLLLNSSVPQNKKSLVTDSGSNKIFELYIALSCMKMSKKILLDNPQNSQGDNPDIIFEFKDKKYGIACKALHSDKHQTLYNNLEKALDQIEKSSSEIGLVIISLKNLIKHEEYWPIINPAEYKKGEILQLGAYKNFTDARNKLISYGNSYIASINNPQEIDNLLKIFSASTKVPPEFYLFLNGTCSYFDIHGRTVTSNQKLLYKISIIDERFSIETYKVAKHINYFMQYGVRCKAFA